MKRLGPIALAAALLSGAPGAPAAPSTSEARVEGRALAARLRDQAPEGDTDFTGVLKTRDRKGRRGEIPVKCLTLVTATNWQTLYIARSTNANLNVFLDVIHTPDHPNRYRVGAPADLQGQAPLTELEGNQAMVPFAGTDFWLFDLGLGFFHWPEQRLAKKEMRRSRFCEVLESLNPEPLPGTYARVLSWIDQEYGVLLRAEAYDPEGKLMKEFSIGGVKKIKGRYYLKDMEIRNERTDSRTVLEMDLTID